MAWPWTARRRHRRDEDAAMERGKQFRGWACGGSDGVGARGVPAASVVGAARNSSRGEL